MAVKTHFRDDDFKQILSHYRLGEYESSQAVTTGSVQTNYILQTTQSRYILRYYENRSVESVRFESNLIQYILDRNYPCPAPQKNIYGKMVGTFKEKPFIIFAFIEGQHLENPGETQKKQLIQKVAELQILTRRYKPRLLKNRWNYSPELCRKLAYEAAQKDGSANAWKKLAWLTQECARLWLPDNLPKGICHCDFHFSNILFREGAFVALLDFDDANYTYLTLDLVTLMDPFRQDFRWNSWSQFERDADILDFGEAKAMVDEYMQYRPLRPIEKRHIFDVFKLSILFDCIWYFERGEVSDFFEKRKIDALNQLGRDAFFDRLFS